MKKNSPFVNLFLAESPEAFVSHLRLHPLQPVGIVVFQTAMAQHP
jgi:hypothetical protein